MTKFTKVQMQFLPQLFVISSLTILSLWLAVHAEVSGVCGRQQALASVQNLWNTALDTGRLSTGTSEMVLKGPMDPAEV